MKKILATAKTDYLVRDSLDRPQRQLAKGNVVEVHTWHKGEICRNCLESSGKKHFGMLAVWTKKPHLAYWVCSDHFAIEETECQHIAPNCICDSAT